MRSPTASQVFAQITGPASKDIRLLSNSPNKDQHRAALTNSAPEDAATTQ